MVDAGSPGNKRGTPRGSSATLRARSGSATKEAFPEMSSHPSEALFHLVSAVQVAQQAGMAALTCAQAETPIGLALLSSERPW